MASSIFDGYLFKVLGAIGSKSEGPEYVLQSLGQWKDLSELNLKMIQKRALPFQADKELEMHLHTKVRIEGSEVDGLIMVTSIVPLPH